MGHTYSLGAVKPWVKTAAYEVGDKFDIGTIYGVGARAGPSDHPAGLALDYMVYTDRAKGDSVAAYLKENWGRLGVKYIIWFQRIDEGSGWSPMADRGGTTANHKDHVHCSFTNTGSAASYSGNATDTGSTATDSGSNLSGSLATATSSATWLRILEFLGGLILILGVAWDVIQHV